MSELMEKILEGKRASREKLASLPIEEKLAILKKLRDRSLAIASSARRQTKTSSIPASGDAGVSSASESPAL